MEEVIKLEGIRIRLAKLPDLEKITLLEREVWGENAATPEQIESRIKTFSEGNYVAEDLFSGNIMGYVCFQYTSDLRVSDNLNWFDITDKGFIARSHKPGGDYLYGVNLSVHHSMNGKDLGKILVFQCFFAYGH